MALEPRPTCEHCDLDLPPQSPDARICTYECTFCADCVEPTLHDVCPNCGGGFAPRPIRPATEWRPALSSPGGRHRPPGAACRTAPMRSPCSAPDYARSRPGGTLTWLGADLLLRDVRPWPRGRAARSSTSRSATAASRRRIGRHRVGPPRGARRRRTAPVGVLLPALADVHAHLDSTRLGLPFRPHTAEPGLAGLIANDRANWRHGRGRGRRAGDDTLAATIASGVTAVRSHAQVDTDCRLERLEGVLAAKEAHAERATVQVVAFPQSGILRDAGPPSCSTPPCAPAPTWSAGSTRAPSTATRSPTSTSCSALAERHGVGVDLHLHETGELGAFTFELIAERTWRSGCRAG